MRFTIHLLLGLVLLVTSLAASAQRKAALPLPNRQSILNGRGYLSFPVGAVNEARQVDLMAATPDDNRETRIVLDFDAVRVVFFARELFRLAGPDLPTQARKLTEGGSSRVLLRTDSVLAVLSTPSRYDSTKAAILLNRLVVRTIDGTAYLMDAYVNPKGLPERADYQALTEKIFASLRPGRRLLNRAAHTESFALGKSQQLQFHLPADHAVTAKSSYDFIVYNIHALTALDAAPVGSVTLYVGSHPSPLYRDMDLSADAGRPVAGRFLGQPVQWLEFAKPDDQMYWREQILRDALGKNGPVVHVVITGTTAALPELTKVVEAIELKK